jgi:hypothetical protein
MLQSVVMHDIPMNRVAAMERWYWREHAPEINRRFGPWLARHESYLPVDAPADARVYGYHHWRVTEGSGAKCHYLELAATWLSACRPFGRRYPRASLRPSQRKILVAEAFSPASALCCVGTAY